MEGPAPLAGGGQALPEPVQQQMEGAFGSDFSEVRVHTDSEQAASIGALAYTQGSDIAFAPGQYAPESQSGQELIGHELAHVVQQGSGRVTDPVGDGTPVNDDPGLESEADAMGARAAQGQVAEVQGKGAGTQPKRGGPVQAKGPGRKTKAGVKGAGIGLGKGLINVFFPVFAGYDLAKNIDEGLSKDNPLYAAGSSKTNGALKTLVVLKEVGQVVAAAATAVATLLGLASIALPALAAAAAVAGLVATVAHAVTFVLRGLMIGGIEARIKTLRKAGDVEAVRTLEKARWGEIAGMIGNGLGVIFGGIGASAMWAAAVKPMGDAGGAGMSTGFGQIGNSLADVTGGGTSDAGGVAADNAATRRSRRAALGVHLAPPSSESSTSESSISGASSSRSSISGASSSDEASSTDISFDVSSDESSSADISFDVSSDESSSDAPAPTGPSPEDLKQMHDLGEMVGDLAAERQKAPSLVVTPDLAGALDTRLGEVQEKGAELGSAAQQLEAVNPADVEGGNPDAISEEQLEAAESAAEVEADGGAGPAEAEDVEAASSSEEAPEEDARDEPLSPAVPVVQDTPSPANGQREARNRDEEAALPKMAEPRPRTASVPVLRKADKAVQPAKKKGGWFRKKVLGRLKKAIAKAKQKFIGKVAKLFGLDVKAASARNEVQDEATKGGSAAQAELGAKAAAAEAAKAADELKKRASGGS